MATEGKVLTERARTGKSMHWKLHVIKTANKSRRDHKLDYIVTRIIKITARSNKI